MRKIDKKLIVSDFDGTLITDEQTVLPSVKNTIDEYVQAGGIFAICTGRMLKSILPRARELGLNGFIIAYQGTVIAEIESGKIIRENGISCSDAAEICKEIKNINQAVNVYANNEMYTDIAKSNEHLLRYERITGINAISVDEPIDNFVLKNSLYCQKISTLVFPAERNNVYLQLKDKLSDRFDVTCSASVLVEISPKGDDKGMALKYLANHYGIDVKDTVAVGDNLNDVSMIKAAGCGVAVGNAVEELKNLAQFVSVSNNDGAIAQVINKFGFKD